MAEVVIGIDGGGTHTRAVAADVTGRILATAKTDAASPNKTVHARQNVQNAIHEVISRAGCALADVVQLVAGIAGLDGPEDLEWAETYTAVPGLHCPRLHLNDAVIAHAGALQSQPGIIAIAGTGSIVFGVTEAGQHFRNYDFYHYAHASARHLSYDAVYRVLGGNIAPEDREFVTEILAFWQVKDASDLRERGAVGFVPDRFERNRLFGEMAPLVTRAAQKEAPLARSVCDAAVAELATGIRLLGNGFARETVAVALIGGAVQSDYMRRAMRRVLTESGPKRYQITDPAFSNEVGAVLMALQRHNIVLNEKILTALSEM